MEPVLRGAIWRSLLQSDQEQRYWHRKACQYVRWDFRSKVFLALVTSSTVASWTLWSDLPVLWKTLTVAASLISIVLPFLSLNDKVLVMTEVHGKWLQLMHEYEELWRDQELVEDGDARVRVSGAKKVESELSSKAISLPAQDRKLGATTYHEVINERTT
ncbi:MAG: hypothetical protein K2Y02_05295 [Burkholderiaceae bacterium]|nr:hypothetical protein [Burkholderiaceae bacterium]